MLHVEEESVLSMLESAEASCCLDVAALPTLVRRFASSRKCWTEFVEELTLQEQLCKTLV